VFGSVGWIAGLDDREELKFPTHKTNSL